MLFRSWDQSSGSIRPASTPLARMTRSDNCCTMVSTNQEYAKPSNRRSCRGVLAKPIRYNQSPRNQGVNASGDRVLENGGRVRRRRVTPVVRRTYADLDNATVEGVWRNDLTPALRSRRSITALMLAVDRNAVSTRQSFRSCEGTCFGGAA